MRRSKNPKYPPATVLPEFNFDPPLQKWLDESDDSWIKQELAFYMGEPYSRLSAAALFRRHAQPSPAQKALFASGKIIILDPVGDFFKTCSEEQVKEARCWAHFVLAAAELDLYDLENDFDADSYLHVCRTMDQVYALWALNRSHPTWDVHFEKEMKSHTEDARQIASKVLTKLHVPIVDDEQLIRACSINPGEWWVKSAELFLEKIPH